MRKLAHLSSEGVEGEFASRVEEKSDWLAFLARFFIRREARCVVVAGRALGVIDSGVEGGLAESIQEVHRLQVE